jgi:type VI secretion system protein ImpH
MAATNGGAAASLAERLCEEGFAFDFFQAVRLLEKLAPERRPVGLEGPPGQEVARFRAQIALNFPASEIHQIDPPGPQGPAHTLTVNFMGLTGPSGVLPRHYTEMLMRARDARGPERYVARDWFDLFNHRLISHFYRAWTKYRFWPSFERGEYAQPEPDLFTECLYSLIGLGSKSLRNRLRVAVRSKAADPAHERVLARVDDLSLIYYAGLLSHRPRCAVSLERLLADYFGVDVRVLQFQGQWLRLDPESQTQMGPGASDAELGMNVIVGDRVWDVRSKIRICLGPLGYERFVSFFPDQAAVPERKDFFKLMHLVRLYVGPGLKVEVQLILKASDIPRCHMRHAGGKGPRLGWNTWLTSQSMGQDSDDAVFDGMEMTWTPETSTATPRRKQAVGQLVPA